jgi:hypothetical protein
MPFSSHIEEPGRLAVLVNETSLFTYHFEEDLPKPYLHPLCLPDGRVLTADSPADHPEHHGLFFGWEEVNGVDFWNEGTASAPGKITTESVTVTPLPEEKRLAVIADHLWKTPEGGVLLREKRSLIALEPEDKGWQLLDWISELHAPDEDAVFLSRRRAMGLSFRGRDDLAGGRFLNSRHREGPETDGHAAEWCAYSAPDRTGPNAAGIAFLAGRRNPHPRPEFHTQSQPFPFLSTSFGYRTPFVVPAGKTVTLKYRIALHSGPMDSISLQMHYTAFIWG